MLVVIIFVGVVTAMLEMIVFMRIPLLQKAAAKNMLVTLILSLFLAKLICGMFHATGMMAAAGAMTGFVVAQGYYKIREIASRPKAHEEKPSENGYVLDGALAASRWLLAKCGEQVHAHQTS